VKRISSRWNGGRHPGLRESGTLRGAPSERRPRSVRQRAVASSTANRRAGDSGCPEVAKEGNVVGMRVKAHALSAPRHRRMRQRTRPSLGPPTRAVDPHYAPQEQSSVVGRSAGIMAGQTRVSGRNQHWGPSFGRARLAARHRLRKEEGVTRKKRKEIEVSVPRGPRARVWLPARRYVVVAEVGRRRLVSKKLGKRAPKRAAGSSERGPNSE
jgi:hypothetical protein